jgi:hypothetical protein
MTKEISMSRKIADRLHDPLEDQGWQQMKVLLDREMPESKRRLIWWPLTGAAATLALLFLGYQFIQSHKEQSLLADSTSADTSVLLEGGPTISSLEPVLDAPASTADLAKSGNFDGASSAPLPLEKKQDRKEKYSNTASVMPDNQQNKGQAADLPFKVNKENEVIDVPEDHLLAGESEVAGFDDSNSISKNELQELVAIESLGSSLKYSYPIQHNEWFEPLTIEHNIEVAKNSVVDFSLATGMLTDNTISKPSFDLGGQIRLKTSGKIAIGLGSFFWAISNNQTFSAVTPPTNSLTAAKDFSLSADQGIQRADSASVPQAGFSYYTGQINNLAYWRVPVFIQFFPSGKWQPYIGASQNILLSDGSQGLLESNGSRDFATVGSGASTSQPITDLVRMSNTAFLIGLTFQTHRHFSIDLAYAHSKLSYLNYRVNEGDFYEYHRFLRFSLAYRF